jgi:inositol oxygenase
MVRLHYKKMRENQTWDFVQKMYKKYHKFDHDKMTILEAFEKLKNYVDSSDPDT